MKVNKKLFIPMLLVVMMLTGCGGPEEPPAATPTSALSINIPARTPAPTSRPLVEPAESDEGQYLNDLFGVSLTYPSRWNLLDSSQDGPRLMVVEHPFYSARVFLFTVTLEQDQTMEDYNIDLMEGIIESIELDVSEDHEYMYDYSIGENLSGERIIQKGSLQGDYVIDVISTEKTGRVFSIIVLSPMSAYGDIEEDLLDIQAGLFFYETSPYGVSRDNAIFFSSGEPETLDPALMQSSAGSIIGDLYSGLVRLDTNLRPIPDLTERWEISEDGTIYTFYLRQDVLFHSGRPFTAQDVKFSWERATDPDLESPTAPTYLVDVLGVSEKLDGEADEISGVKVIDDYTIEVTLDAPKAYFLAKLSYPTSWIVDSETVDDIEDNPIGTGPFKMLKHEEDEIIILARNENYYGGFVQLEYIVYLLYQGYSNRMYEAGTIDTTSISEELLDRANEPNDPLYGNVQSVSGLCSFYILFDNSRPPFDDPKVREAFARAVNKERYNEIVTDGKGVIASGLLPPGIPGYTPDIKPLAYNEELAFQALADSSYGSAENLPEITFTARGGGSGLSSNVGFLIGSWEDLFDISIKVEQIESRDYWDEVQAGNHGNIVNLGWCADYPDPENFLDLLFHSEANLNVSKFNNPEYDALIEEARVETDITARLALYQQAEQILVNEAGGIFLGHSRASYHLYKSYVKGYVITPIGVAQMMNVYIEHDE